MDATGQPARPAYGAPRPRTAVLIPCFNEEAAIGGVIAAFRAALPEATIHVYDNNSADRTAEVARAAGAVVRTESLQGKGHVVRRMFADVEASVFVLVDGDDTYDAAAAPALIRMLEEGQLDMVTATREGADPHTFRRGHRAGNALLSGMVRLVFGNRVSDVLSGYRVFSRRFVKSFPALSAGFETETEFTVHALELCMPIGELRTRYRGRAAGSASKLRTWTDGLRILRAIITLMKEERPLQFFAAAASALFAGGVGAALPVIVEYARTGMVPRLPTAVLATGLVLAAALALACGLILDFGGARAQGDEAARLSVGRPMSGRWIAGAPGPAAFAYDADVVILALDRPAETMAAIASALAQRGVRRHVFVIDQGSRPENLERLAEAVSGNPDATLFSMGENIGVAGGRNRGAALGHGRVIVGLDNDAVFDSADIVAAAVAALDDDAKLGAIGLRVLIDRTGTDDKLSWGYPQSLFSRAGEIFDSVTFVGAGHAIRRVAWEAAGAYDEALFFTWEEMDLCQRLIGRGWRVRYHGNLAIRHKVCPERRLDWSDGRWFHFVRNRLYIARKHGATSPALLALAGGYALKGARNGMGRETLRAIAAAARMDAGVPAPPDAAARAYFDRHDRAHRGAWRTRLRTEVFARLPGTAGCIPGSLDLYTDAKGLKIERRSVPGSDRPPRADRAHRPSARGERQIQG